MGTPYNKLKMLRGMVKISSNDEIQFLQTVAKESKHYDVALWFGSAYDPVSLRLPSYCNCPILFHMNDSPFLYEKRQITKRLKIIRTWVAKQHERRILASGYARVIYVSQEDYEIGIQLSKVQNSAKVICLPTGVDIKIFRPRSFPISNPGKIVLLFTGVMFYQPNVDAALHLIKRIMPQIHHHVELRIVGRDPTSAIVEAAKADDRIVVTGTVRDMAAEYQAADIFVAPMISAAGIKIKILQAMSCGLPVIATPMCVKAFPETPDGILTGDTTDQITNIIERLISNEAERRELGRKGRMFIEKKWSWEQRTEALVRICHDVIDCKI
jgi:glycosyltransferase involved in cell wall biosynthesis